MIVALSSCPRDIIINFPRLLCRVIPIRSLLGCLFVPQLLRLSHHWIPRVFLYSWLLPHVLSWTRKWDSWISELASSVSLWLLSLATMHSSSVDCSVYPLGFYYVHTFVKFLALNIYVINIWLVSRYYFTWVFCWSVCELLHLWFYFIGIEFVDFCVSFLLSENELYIKYVFDTILIILMGRPPWHYSMLIIGWWYYILEQRLQGHYTLYLYYVKLLLCTPALLPVPLSFLGALPPPCLSPTLPPILPLPLTSYSTPPNLDRPITTTSGIPSTPASGRNAHSADLPN